MPPMKPTGTPMAAAIRIKVPLPTIALAMPAANFARGQRQLSEEVPIHRPPTIDDQIAEDQEQG